jgi:hypothetical protein
MLAGQKWIQQKETKITEFNFVFLVAFCFKAECRGLAPLATRHALVSTKARPACPVDIPSSIVLVLLLVLVIENKNSRTRTRTRRK